MEKASFSIDKYFFDKVIIDLTKRTSDKLSVKFDPSGVFNKKDSTYDLTFNFYAISSDDDNASPFVFMRCIGVFKFDNVTSLSEIPSYFYRNSIALLFPYLRAYVSMVTNQANIPAVILPTMNLMSLEEPLRKNTIEK